MEGPATALGGYWASGGGSRARSEVGSVGSRDGWRRKTEVDLSVHVSGVDRPRRSLH